VPAYSSPTADFVRLLTGVSEEVEALFPAELDDVIEELLPTAEAWLEGHLTQTTFELATHTARTVLRMQAASSFKTAEFIHGRFSTKAAEDAHDPIAIDQDKMIEARQYHGRQARHFVLILKGELARAALEPAI
jgi:hypothetical protein